MICIGIIVLGIFSIRLSLSKYERLRIIVFRLIARAFLLSTKLTRQR